MQNDFKKLIQWSKQFDSLPWRQNRSLYHTLVSEIMLQQTTVNTVISKFESFIEQYPNISLLASASEEEMLIAWKGLGYYRRAKNLLKAAQYITSHHASEIPLDYHQLIKIPGIGDYTANALLSIGDDQKALAIDTNLERVLSRYYKIDVEKGPALKKHLQKLLDTNKIFDFNISFRDLNEAIMDLGREYCTTSRTKCEPCPLKKNCLSINNPLARPKLKLTQKTKITHNLSLLRVLITDNNKIWCYEKSKNEWLAGQWESPTFIIDSDDDNIKQYPALETSLKILQKNLNIRNLQSYKTAITKYKITNYVLTLSLKKFKQEFNWTKKLVPIELRVNQNLSTSTSKALKIVTYPIVSDITQE